MIAHPASLDPSPLRSIHLIQRQSDCPYLKVNVRTARGLQSTLLLHVLDRGDEVDDAAGVVAGRGVVTGAAVDGVSAAVAGEDAVVAGAGVDVIAAGAGGDGVVPGRTVDRVVAAVAAQDV